jgi:hypothetical protein
VCAIGEIYAITARVATDLCLARSARSARCTLHITRSGATQLMFQQVLDDLLSKPDPTKPPSGTGISREGVAH